jgi:hypothetical protein
MGRKMNKELFECLKCGEKFRYKMNLMIHKKKCYRFDIDDEVIDGTR